MHGFTIVFLLLVLVGCESKYDEKMAFGTLERDRIELTAETSEPISAVYVQEGQMVTQGTVLVQQDPARAEVALAKGRADEAVGRAALMEAEAGPRQQQILGARARLEAESSAVKTLGLELERAQSLLERKLASQSQVDTLQGRFEEAEARLEEAGARLDELLEGTRTEMIEQVRSRHTASVAVVNDLAITLDRTSIRAPIAGLIETLPYEIGERPISGATIVVLLANQRIYAKVHIPEPLRTQLEIGSRAEIRMDGRSDVFAGKLRWISSSAAFTPYFALSQYDRSRLSYLAEIDLDSQSKSLPIGVPVEVTFPDLSQ